MEVGAKIKALRKAQRMTQQMLADRMSTDSVRVAASAINRYETGKIVPKLQTQEKIAEAFGMSLQAFLNYGEAEPDQALISRFRDIVATYVPAASQDSLLSRGAMMGIDCLQLFGKEKESDPEPEHPVLRSPTYAEKVALEYISTQLDLMEKILPLLLNSPCPGGQEDAMAEFWPEDWPKE